MYDDVLYELLSHIRLYFSVEESALKIAGKDFGLGLARSIEILLLRLYVDK